MFKKHPQWGMQGRNLFKCLDYEKGTCTIDGKEYEMKSCHFPTVDPSNPSKLTIEEKDLVEKLHLLDFLVKKVQHEQEPSIFQVLGNA